METGPQSTGRCLRPPWLGPPHRGAKDRFFTLRLRIDFASIFALVPTCTKKVSQSDRFGSWTLLVPQKVKSYPKMGLKDHILGPPKWSTFNMFAIFIETQIIRSFP